MRFNANRCQKETAKNSKVPGPRLWSLETPVYWKGGNQSRDMEVLWILWCSDVSYFYIYQSRVTRRTVREEHGRRKVGSLKLSIEEKPTVFPNSQA